MARESLAQLREATAHSPNPPSPTSSSDKENTSRHSNKRNTNNMAPGKASSASKRRRLSERSSNTQSRLILSPRNGNDTRKYYDPDQDDQERRQTRAAFRELTTGFNNSRNEYLQTGNTGIIDTITKANELYVNVKQTSDATIDSRLLANAADLSYRKAAQLSLGDSNAGIDVDEFVSKCIAFMRRGPDISTLTTSAPRRRRPATQRDPNASDDEEDEGDAMNWDWLGWTACLPCNARPVVSGWLLGPLSVQKRTRQFTQRTQNEQFNATQLDRPQLLQQSDLEEQDKNHLTIMCKEINKLLAKIQSENEDEVSAILSGLEMEGELTPEAAQEVMDKHNIADDGGVPLFKFCINPNSFGQSVENLFYVSFLVRDGNVGVSTDSRGLPTLHSSEPYQPSEAQRRGIEKCQSVFSLDFDSFEEIVTVFKITEPMIPDREVEQAAEETATTWQTSN